MLFEVVKRGTRLPLFLFLEQLFFNSLEVFFVNI